MLPEVDAGRADADLFGYFCNGETAPKASVTDVMCEDRLASHE
jgi:hypothetical protein